MAGWLPLFAPNAGAKVLRIGAGGFLRGIDRAYDDSMLSFSDTYGAWLYDPNAANPGNAGGTGSWNQLMTTARVSSSEAAVDLVHIQNFAANNGCYEARFCRNNSNFIYLGFNGYLFKSSNKGASFASLTTPFTPAASADMQANDPGLVTNNSGPKLAVDPINSSVVYFSLNNGRPWYSFDGGASWTQIGAGSMAAPSANTFTAFAYDPRVSTQSGGVSTRLFAFVQGTGCYLSTNAGSGTPTWTKISGSGTSQTGLTGIHHIIVDTQGNAWVTDSTSALNNVWKYDTGGTWTNVNWSGMGATEPAWAIAEDIHVASAQRFVTISIDFLSMQSNDGGVNWTSGSNGARAATDIPTLSYLLPDPQPGDLIFDSTGLCWLATGVGIYTSIIATNWASFTWTSRSAAIEGLTSNEVIASSNGTRIVNAWDRALYVSANPNVYPSTVNPQSIAAPPGSSTMDWATANPSTYAAVYYGTLYVWNGSSWSSKTNGSSAGYQSIAAASATNFVICPAGGNLNYTTDGGTNWTDLGSYFQTNFSVTPNSISLNPMAQPICPDRVNSNTFYVHLAACIFFSNNSGVTWTKMSTDGTGSGIPTLATIVGGNEMLRSVNGRAGHLIYCSGQTYQGVHPYTTSSNTYISTDGGGTWADLSANIRDVWGIDTGVTVGSYPRIIAWCWKNVSGTWTPGVWFSDDQGSTWAKLCEQSIYGTYDWPRWLEADKQTASNFYISFSGSGYGYYG